MIRTGINITIAAAAIVIFIGIFHNIFRVVIIFILRRRLRYLDAFAPPLFFNQLKRINEEINENQKLKIREFIKFSKVLKKSPGPTLRVRRSSQLLYH
jgi:hypothetical protein